MYLAIDEGTTNIKEVLFDEDFIVKHNEKRMIRTLYPRPSWVEQNPNDIWDIVAWLLHNFENEDVKTIGITNQRETTVLWNSESGEVVHNAIVWSCRRTAEFMDHLKEEYEEIIKEKTGLKMDAYFSASKIRWILDHVPNLRDKIKDGHLRFGTIDSFLLWKLTGGRVHATDHTNASRTMLYNIKTGYWDDELLEIFKIPSEILPEIMNSDSQFGETHIGTKNVPITGIMGDQQSSLFAQGCFRKGDLKITYGTGTFVLANTGKDIYREPGVFPTVAWSISSGITYAMEGGIFSSGNVVNWLKKIGLWSEEIPGESSLYFVPAFTGLGAPYWDQFARGLIIGVTPNTKSGDITRAALESIAYMARDILETITKRVHFNTIKVDGGMTANEFLMKFQSDILGLPVMVSEYEDITALGAAMIASMGAGIKEMDELHNIVNYITYEPEQSDSWRNSRYELWKKAVRRSMRWISDKSMRK